MAYPFRGINGLPQTPQYAKGMESPQRRLPRTSNRPVSAYKCLILMAVVCTVLFFYIINAISQKKSKVSDRIPFSSEQVDEWVLPKELQSSRANVGPTAISNISKVIRNALSSLWTSTFHPPFMAKMHQRTLHTAEIELLYSML